MKIKPLENSELFNQLHARQIDLSTSLARVTAERRALAQNDEPEISVIHDSAAARRVAELLGQAPPIIPPNKRERLAEMAEQERDLRTAVDRLGSQISAERKRVEDTYTRALHPEFRSRLRAVVDAMKNVHAATLDLHELTSAIDSQGISISRWPSFSPSLLGSPVDPYSAMARFFREAIEYGVIEKREMPKELGHR